MQAVHDKSEVSIGEYLAVLRRRWLWVAGTVVVLVGLVLARDLQQDPVYRASTQLLLQSKASENIFQPIAQSPDPTRAVQNELRIINSRVVRSQAREAYGGPISVSAVAGGDDDIIILSATDTNAAEAARKANVYAETYQSARVAALLEDLTTARAVLQTQIDDFQGQIDAVNGPVALLDERIVDTPLDDPRLPALQAQRDQVQRQTDGQRQELETQLADYQQRLQILQLSERLTTTGGVQILNPAQTPSSPVSPTILRDVMQTLIIALFLGVGLAFLRDQLDDSVRTKADLDRLAPAVPGLVMIPQDTAWRSANEARLSTVVDPSSAVSESFRALRTSLQYLSLARPMALVQLTSANAGEGKTTTLANLAVAFARAGKKVCVVGCDLRKPRLAPFFEVDPSIGLTQALLGERTVREAIQSSPVHPNIDVLDAGPRPPNPSELLSLDRTSTLLRGLCADYSIVFIDCPPVLPVTDALVLSRSVDATLFLASAERTSKREAKRAIEMLQQVDSPIIGTVLNGVPAEDSYGSLYAYYGQEVPSRSLSSILRRRGRRHSDTSTLDTSHVPDQEGHEPQDPPPAEADDPDPDRTTTGV